MAISVPKNLGGLLSLGLVLSPAIAVAAPVQFTVAPEAGSARIILALHFATCRLRNINPWSATACPYWRPIVSGQAIELAGEYCVFATWGGNRVHRSSLLVPLRSGQVRYAIRPNSEPAARACP